jgi:hypothetical protein
MAVRFGGLNWQLQPDFNRSQTAAAERSSGNLPGGFGCRPAGMNSLLDFTKSGMGTGPNLRIKNSVGAGPRESNALRMNPWLGTLPFVLL